MRSPGHDKTGSSSKKHKSDAGEPKSDSKKHRSGHKSSSSSSRSRHSSRTHKDEKLVAPPPPSISGHQDNRSPSPSKHHREPRHRSNSPSSKHRDHRDRSHSPSSKHHREREDDRKRKRESSVDVKKERDSPLLLFPSSEPASFSTGVSSDWAVFRGPEHGPLDTKDLKRIQIDIRRNIPDVKITGDEVVNRDLGDPAEFKLPRRADEGLTPIFARDDVFPNKIVEAKPDIVPQVRINIAPLAEYERRLESEITGTSGYLDKKSSKLKDRSKSPRKDRDYKQEDYRMDEDYLEDDLDEEESERVDVRARLGGKEKSTKERKDVRERLGVSVKDRLGEQIRDDDHRGYDGGYKAGRGYRGARRGRGGYHHRGRGRKSDFTSLRRSDDWKYEVEEPSSTTD